MRLWTQPFRAVRHPNGRGRLAAPPHIPVPMPLRRLSAALPLAIWLIAAAPDAAAQQAIGQNAALGPSGSDPAAPYYTPTEPNVPEKAGKVLRAFRLEGAAPAIDGALDEVV